MASVAAQPIATDDANTPSAIYTTHLLALRDIIATDRFGNTVPDSLIDLWLHALDPVEGHKLPIPPEVKGFYGGDLRSSIPIELAHDSYKFILHEFQDEEKTVKYATRMLIALGLLDLDDLIEKDANLAGLALWHRALAMVRLPMYCGANGKNGGELEETLTKYEVVRRKSNLPDSKLPQPARLKVRLSEVARGLGNESAMAWLNVWKPKDGLDATTEVSVSERSDLE